MRQFKLTIAYDGTNYYGWQIQPDKISIVQTMQDTFALVFGQSIQLTGASRTDAGVHAMGQVAAFTTDLEIPHNKMLFAWNNLLPQEIRILDLQDVAIDFHPYRAKTNKTYWYHIFTEQPLPFTARYGWYVNGTIDFEKLKECLHIFVGTHDFRAFCTIDSDCSKSTVRTIDAITFEYVPEWRVYRIAFMGPGFLQHMIRRIVGACITVALKKELSVAYLHSVLISKNSNTILPTAPAQGLLLHKIEYK